MGSLTLRRAAAAFLIPLMALMAASPAASLMTDERERQMLAESGSGAWFYIRLLPGTEVRPEDGAAIATGTDRNLRLDYGRVSKTMGLLEIPPLPLLYFPQVYPNTFRIVNKTNVPITVGTRVITESVPGAKQMEDIVFAIPASSYIGAGFRQPSYTFVIPPHGQETVVTVVVTGSLVELIVGLLLFETFPVGDYGGYVRLSLEMEGRLDTVEVPVAVTVY